MEKQTLQKSKFNKVLNKKDVFALAFGAMIGWSWVTMSGEWILGAGTLGAILAFALGGILVLFVGFTYAELTSAMPQCGGEHVFSFRALGKNFSFVCTWAIILGYIGVVAFEAVAFPTVVQYIAPDFLQGYMYTIAGFDVYASWVAVGVIAAVFITVLNLKGAKPAAALNLILTFTILTIGLVLMAGSAINGSSQNLDPLFDSGFNGFLSIAVMTPFCYVGFDVIPQAAEEINIPYKKIGKILILSIVMSVIWYAVIILAVSFVMSKGELSASSLPTADAMKNAFFSSSLASKILIVGGMAGIVTSWNSFFVGGSRAIYSLAESKMLPEFLAKISPKSKIPTNAVLLVGICSCIAPFFGRSMMVWLTNAGSFAVVLAYLMVSISFLVLRKKEPEMNRPYKVKHGTFVGIMAIFMSGFMSVLYIPGMPSGLTLQECIIVGLWVILGVGFYISAKSKFKLKFGTMEQIEYIDPAVNN